MTMNFTAILEPGKQFKPDSLSNSIIFCPSVYYFEHPLAPLNNFLSNLPVIIKSWSYNIAELIHDATSTILMDNVKFSFLLMYIVSITLFVIFLERIRKKKKSKYPKKLEDEKEYFIEKMLLHTGDEKEIMSCEVKEEILKKLSLFEEGTKYTDRNLNLSALSVKLKTNTKYLSYIINKYKKKDFNSYINELRILYIIKKMQTNPAYLNYKISYLADECGFSSHSKFTAVFKSVVGMSPSRFMDMLTKRTK